MQVMNKILRRFGVHDAIYDDKYYQEDVEGPAVQASAIVASTIIDRYRPRTLMDVGCGAGAMLAAFRDRGVSVTGLEYSKAGLRRCQARGLSVTKFDIENDTLRNNATYDLVLSLEVAEHLPEHTADRYVGLLARLSRIVIISAAKPGQGGTDHVNLKPKSYWISKVFADRIRIR